MNLQQNTEKNTSEAAEQRICVLSFISESNLLTFRFDPVKALTPLI